MDYFKIIHLYNRERLYEEVWATPTTQLAKRYEVSTSFLTKLCKNLNVPKPSSSYWNKLKYDVDIFKEPLPQVNDNNLVKIADETFLFLDENERIFVFDIANKLKISSNYRCEEVRQIKEKIIIWNKTHESNNGKNTKPSDYRHKYRYYSHSEMPPIIAGVVSNENVSRACHIIDALLDAVKKMGGSLSEDGTFRVQDESVKFDIFELKEKVDYVPKADDIAHLNIGRKFSYLFNGNLSFVLDNCYRKSDTLEEKLEDSLGDIFLNMVIISQVYKIKSIEKKEQQEKEEAIIYKRKLEKEIYDKEVAKFDELMKFVDNFERANSIRNFVHILENSSLETDPEWIEWARNKADWIDPTLRADDKILGKFYSGNNK
ncbi:hypothetical protein [Kineothrix sp. MB12-C1]|uniref:hypothetical protein n=1 Tax=Kineothrix sp. MB12-C1 TaxID=3070215 RepID=UPI0027D2A23F|nr:hypothetical protein [Kineothrix sp. MB12-C1]WMC93214.1 hypothetical protein RBB56_02710 [Kineothrix sp. MB12-C1]